MIGKLKGLVDSSGADWVVVDVNGVGYHLYCATRTLDRLPPPDGEVRLFVDTHVREDHIHLYGFLEETERDWFRLLQTVQGVGARVALAILSVMTPSDIVQSITAQDKAALTRANGVGARVAERIVNELKEKAGAMVVAAELSQHRGDAAPAAADGDRADAVSALENLGYRRTEAHMAVLAAATALGAEAPLETLISSALKELVR